MTFSEITVADILGFVADRRREDLTLDFKLAPTNFANRDDRRTLAIALSGFANSSGGLVVWGVDARQDDDEIDCAIGAQPLANAELFMSRLIEHGGAATSPPVSGVQHRLVDDAPGGPFAVTYVPESDGGPHMGKLGEDRYYKRSGARFYMMEHFDLADMFGRRRAAKLHVSARSMSGDPARAVVSLRNTGRGPAIAPYLALRFDGPIALSPRGVDGNYGSWTLARLPLDRDSPHRAAFGGDASVVIHPGVELGVAVLEARAPNVSQLMVTYEVAADGAPLTAGTIALDRDPGAFVKA